MNMGRISTAHARQHLLNVITELRDGVLPSVDDAATKRASECLEALARIAVALRPPSESTAGDLGAEAAEIEEGEALYKRIITPSSVAQEELDRAHLERWLAEHLPNARQIRLSSVKQLVGGRSKKTILVSQTGCSALPEHLVLRCDANAALIGTSVTSEYALLKRLHHTGLRVPQPIWMNAEQSPVGGAFIVVERLPGKALGDFFSAPPDKEVVLQLADQLANLHRLTPPDLAGCDGLRTTSVSAASLAEELKKLRADITQHGDGSPIEASACDWLQAHLNDAEPLLGLVHGDLGFHNILIQDNRISALLDWELAHIGHPAEDLGYCRSAIEGVVDWHAFVARYREGGAPPISDAAIDFYTLWVIVRFHALAVRVRSSVVAGAVPGLDLTLTSLVFPPNLLRLMARYLARFS
jgi:aminoglycoside phosphotransferase (APT) family kinase protein